MLSLFAYAALAAAPSPALTPDQTQRIRCVAVLGIVAFEQERRTAAALALPPLARDGARFAEAVGEALVKETGRSQEQVRDLILAEVASAQKRGAMPVAEAEACVPLMRAVAPPPPPADPVRCAGALRLAADDVRRREGMSSDAMTMLALAAALEDRARTERRAAGSSEAESDRALALAREAIAAAPDTAPDTGACLELARP